jgi:hypothetical protein
MKDEKGARLVRRALRPSPSALHPSSFILMNPSTFTPATPRVRRKRRQVSTSTPAALTLVVATFDPGEAQVVLAFDRAIDIAALDGTQITIDDATSETLYDASGSAVLLTPASVRMDVNAIGESIGAGTTLSATAANGIVAVDDGGTWAGVTDLELPFP